MILNGWRFGISQTGGPIRPLQLDEKPTPINQMGTLKLQKEEEWPRKLNSTTKDPMAWIAWWLTCRMERCLFRSVSERAVFFSNSRVTNDQVVYRFQYLVHQFESHFSSIELNSIWIQLIFLIISSSLVVWSNSEPRLCQWHVHMGSVYGLIAGLYLLVTGFLSWLGTL
jgi:hypothetical protein